MKCECQCGSPFRICPTGEAVLAVKPAQVNHKKHSYTTWHALRQTCIEDHGNTLVRTKSSKEILLSSIHP